LQHSRSRHNPQSNRPQETSIDERWKYSILFDATILCARKLIEMELDKPNMAKGYIVDRAIDDAAFILERIDARWPTIVNSFSAKEH
jgi:hypothetical protein